MPEASIAELVSSGVTTVIGILGTDGVSRYFLLSFLYFSYILSLFFVSVVSFVSFFFVSLTYSVGHWKIC